MQCNDVLWQHIKSKKAKPQKVDGGWRATFPIHKQTSVGITVAHKYSLRYLQYDLKPTELDAVGFSEFLAVASTFGNASYPSALTAGRVSKIEIAIDFLSKDSSDLLAHKAGIQYSHYFYPVVGGARTIYLGSLKGDKVAIYTKMLPKHIAGHTWEAKRARIEVRRRHLGIPPVELKGIPNPFVPVRIYSISAAQSLPVKPQIPWKPFLQLADANGIAHALRLFPKHRKSLLGHLDQCRVPWWTPGKYLEKWETTVARQLRLHLAEHGKSGVA